MKDIKQLSEDEVQERIEDLDKEIQQFNTDAIPQILKILEEGGYGIVVSCYGLVAIVNALVNEFGTEDLLKECVNYLENGFDEITDIN